MFDFGYAVVHGDILKIFDNLLEISKNQTELAKAAHLASNIAKMQQIQIDMLKRRVEVLETGSLVKHLRPLDPNDGAV